jgi:hypothetical protein
MPSGATSPALRLERDVPGWFHDLAQRTGAFDVTNVEPTPRAADHDVVLHLSPATGKAPVVLLVEAKLHATPGQVLGFLGRRRDLPRRAVPVLCSPLISPRVAELCREHDVGYLDAAGNCHIAAPGLFLHVEGRAPVRRDEPKSADPFAVKSSRIVRVLLSDTRRGWQVQELARECDVSLGLASRVKNELVREAYAELRERKLHVRDPESLLNAWSAKYAPPAEHRLYMMDDPPRVERRIAAWSATSRTRYALAGFSGAWRTAPMVRTESTTAYVDLHGDRELREFKEQLGAKEAPSGANLLLWQPLDDFTFYGAREGDGLTVAASLQLYLDLARLPGRGEEAAREVLETEIRPRW